MTDRDSAPLERVIGVGGSGLLSFNGIVGAAIFALPATLLIDWGPFSPYLFLIVGLAALLVIWPFANSAAAFPDSGGPATYGLVYGRFAAFELGWVYYVARVAGLAANVNVLADYLGRWTEYTAAGAGRAAIIVACCLALAAINIAGFKQALRILGGFTVLKTVPLIVAAAAGLILFAPVPPPEAPASMDKFQAAFLITFYAFVGFENAVVPAGETKNPRLTLPRAILLTTAVTAALYFLVQLAFVTVFSKVPSGESAPLVHLGSAVGGPLGAAALTLAAIFSLSGNLLSGTASTPRVTYAMAARGDLPGWFADVNRKFVTPANSIAFLSLFVAALAVSGSFIWLAIVSTLARLIVYVATIAALPLVKGARQLNAGQWLSGALGIAICLFGAAQGDLRTWATFAALMAAGFVLYGIAAALRRQAARLASAGRVSAIQPPPSNRDPS